MTSPLLKASAASLAEIALRGDHAHPNHGDDSAERLQGGEPHPEENPRSKQDKRGDGALDDGEIERARVMGGEIEERVEGRESGSAHDREVDPARAERRPVLPQRRAGGDVEWE